MARNIVVLVTGANRGIGFGIVQSLSGYFSDSKHNTHHNTFTILLAGRNATAVEEAVARIQAELPQAPAPSVVIEGLVIDVLDDESISAAVQTVQEKFGHLDVLVNNAGIATDPGSTPTESRLAYRAVMEMNITSVAAVTTAFAPLLQRASTNGGRRGLVVNISSARGSITRLTNPTSPKTMSVPYSVSKVALNGLTLEMAKVHDRIEFQIVSPGHCRTEFNGFRGKRDPREGAAVVTLLVERWLSTSVSVGNEDDNASVERVECGFWETVGDEWKLSRIPW